METNEQARRFEYRPCAEQRRDGASGAEPRVRPVVVIGAGPVGLAAAIDLARQQVPVVLLDDDCTLATGSRAICFAKRTLDIFDRLGCGERMVEKGVRWNVGRVFFDQDQVYSFDLLPEPGHRRPAFINMQQYYVEGYLVDRAGELPGLELHWKHRVTGLSRHDDHVALTVDTPDGPYTLRARYVVVADGARSPVRAMMGLESRGRTFRDRFLIADVRMAAGFPAERWFWFDPPFNRNQSVLLHRQPDNVWRIDFQLGWDADPEVERQPGRVTARLRQLLGDDAQFTLEWVSVYTFSCQRMARFRHGRVLFAGDAAHRVSPFGARGANSGVQDAENLAWKLRLVLNGQAPDALLDSYADEREFAADENILHSTRSTDFITPKSDASRGFRDAVLRLAREHPFARQLVNSGRLSTPTVLTRSPLNTRDVDAFAGAMVPGAACADAPVRECGNTGDATRDGWLLERLGDRFALLCFADADGLAPETLAALGTLADAPVPVDVLCIVPAGCEPRTLPAGIGWVQDREGLAAQRYDGRPGTCYLLRPDQHVCARWRVPRANLLHDALRRALALAAPAVRDETPARDDAQPALRIEPNLQQPDEFYEALIDMHRELDAAQSHAANAQLILLLANHIGDAAVLRDAMARARAAVPRGPGGGTARDGSLDGLPSLITT
ncbi:3-(3-hydroxy-phenyl)propionate hydroxylase [Cupriavidus gilardii J11]|uniref:3-(3-hydroxy-phenyl)propionate hydroxylase n=1 Tax=Cupriavidus gilardii J11 TaxID=936133 RepID=A0A562BM25_9BURK|nr:FAD-dependent monooxygenase [Cupriavidus gilardii]TWG85980.1 3-(3-hydroxy-phenyl)propionate hydroxylase [Cupriavidus gilardii J11]